MILPRFLLFLHLYRTLSAEVQEGEADIAARGFSEATPKGRFIRVLLLSSYFVGHQIPMISIGEELVRRRHNVTLFTTEMKGSNVVPQLVERAGLFFLSAGPERLSREVNYTSSGVAFHGWEPQM